MSKQTVSRRKIRSSKTEEENVSFSRTHNTHKRKDDKTHKTKTHKNESFQELPKIPEEIWTKCMEFSLLIFKFIQNYEHKMNWTNEIPKRVQKIVDLDLHIPLAQKEFYTLVEQTKATFVENLQQLVLAELLVAKNKIISDIEASMESLKIEYWPYIEKSTRYFLRQRAHKRWDTGTMEMNLFICKTIFIDRSSTTTNNINNFNLGSTENTKTAESPNPPKKNPSPEKSSNTKPTKSPNPTISPAPTRGPKPTKNPKPDKRNRDPVSTNSLSQPPQPKEILKPTLEASLISQNEIVPPQQTIRNEDLVDKKAHNVIKAITLISKNKPKNDNSLVELIQHILHLSYNFADINVSKNPLKKLLDNDLLAILNNGDKMTARFSNNENRERFPKEVAAFITSSKFKSTNYKHRPKRLIEFFMEFASFEGMSSLTIDILNICSKICQNIRI